jgi:hypothetical protein
MMETQFSALGELVNELKQSSKPQYKGILFPVHTRLQAETYGLIEVLTNYAGTSRNKLVNQLLEVGLEATLSALPSDLSEQLQRSAHEVVMNSTGKPGGSWERGDA